MDKSERRRRAGAIGGAAMAAVKKRRAAKESEQQQPGGTAQAPSSEPAQSGGPSPEAMERLKELGELHEQNVLTDEEFEREKAKVLGD